MSADLAASSATAPRVALISIGDELLAGAHPDLNGPYLAAELNRLGLAVDSVAVVPDAEDVLAEALSRAIRGHDLVLTTGGLGPTEDDLTRHAAARALGQPLEERGEAWDHVVALFRVRDRVPTANNRRQALFPAGARLLENRVGTAHGFLCETPGGGWLASLPGPPRELGVVWPEVLAPLVAQRFADAQALSSRSFTLAGLGESIFAERAAEWMGRAAGERTADAVELGVSAREGFLAATFRARGAPAARVLELRAAAFAERFSAEILYPGTRAPERELVRRLTEPARTLALAESCTGGLVAERVTSVPGASAVFAGGLVTYSNAAKADLLGVDPGLIEERGAVSPEVAAAMARGAAGRLGTDLALSITGIAGPGGGSPEKPVGLVYLGLFDAGRVHVAERRFPPGDRGRVRTFAANAALELLLRAVAGQLSAVRHLEPWEQAD